MCNTGTIPQPGTPPSVPALGLRPPLGRTALALIALLLFSQPVLAQGLFGKNKVQYEARDWYTLRTPHTEIFFYPDEEDLAREVAAIAESTCVEFDQTFNLQLDKPIPILLYNSHQHFQQTNAAGGMISEGTGGLTELIKGRVLLPHTGSRHRLIWVTRHELVHAYMLIKIGQVLRANKKYRYSMPPLWFIEGLAEFVSTTWDSQAEGLMRDAVVSNLAVPLTQSAPITGTVLMYKEGQSFLEFLAEKYSRQHVLDILENWDKAESFEGVFRYVFDAELTDLDAQWFQEQKRRYYPCIETCYWTDEVARQLTDGYSYNLGPVMFDAKSDTSYRFFYLSANNGATDLKMATVDGDEIEHERLIRGGFSTQFESFHLFRSQLGVSSTGLVALVAQQEGRDVLHIYDGADRELLHTWAPPGIVGLTSPSFMPNDSAVVVSAQRLDGRTDLIIVRVADGQTRFLLDDEFDDVDPTANPDGGRIVFASDRDGGRDGWYHLYEYHVQTGKIERLTSGAYNDLDPMWSPDGSQLVFRSDRDGIADLYLYRGGQVRPISHFLGPARSPSWHPNGKSILFAGQSKLTFHVYELDLTAQPDTGWVEQPVDKELLAWQPVERADEPAETYTRRFGLDIAQNGVSLDPTLGAAGAGQLALTDMLGNEAIYMFLANDAESIGSFLDGMEVGVTYFNRSRRMNYGIGAFRLTRIYDPDLDLVRRERRVGGSLIASYPISKFNRVEASFVLRYAQDHLLRNRDYVDVWLASNFLTYVHDNVRWTRMGPAGGMRWNVGGGYTRDLTTGQGDFFTVRTDFRRYIEPVTSVVSATRFLYYGSYGDDPQTNYLGGRFTLRGWGRRALVGQQTVLLQQELRFPLWRGLRFGFPVGWTFPRITAAVFGDLGTAGDFNRPWQTLGAVGAGGYIGGGYFPALRLDVMKRFSEYGFERGTTVWFTFGFNY